MTTKQTTHHTTARKAKPVEQVADGVGSVIALSQKTAGVMLKTTVQTAHVAENYVQGMYKVGYDTQIASLEVAKAYWDSMSKIRNEWLKLFAETGEKMVDSATDVELPFQKEVMHFGKNIVDNAQKVVENFTAPIKAAAK